MSTPSQTTKAKAAQRHGVFVRLHEEDKQRAQYWAAKRGYESMGEYISEAVAEKVARENGDYDLPTLEIARLNELVDLVTSLVRNQANLELYTRQGFDSLIGLTRGGHDYLATDDDDAVSQGGLFTASPGAVLAAQGYPAQDAAGAPSPGESDDRP